MHSSNPTQPERDSLGVFFRWFCLSLALSCAAIALGAWWWGDWSIGPYGNNSPLAPITALPLLLLGVGLALLILFSNRQQQSLVVTFLLTAIVTVISAILCLRATGLEQPFESWLKVIMVSGGTGNAVMETGRMSLVSLVALSFVTFSLLMRLPLFARVPIFSYTETLLVLLGLCLGVATVIAYSTGTPLRIEAEGVPPMAFATAAALTLLNLAFLLSGRTGLLLRSWVFAPAGSSIESLDHTFRRRMVLMAAILAAALALGGIFNLSNVQDSTRHSAHEKLSAIADLKVAQIVRWRQERTEEANFLLHSSDVAEDFSALLAQRTSEHAQREFNQWLKPIVEREGYTAIFVFDSHQAPVLTVSHSKAQKPAELSLPSTQAASRREIYWGDLQRDPTTGAIWLDLLVPIFHQPDSPSRPTTTPHLPETGALLGYVMLRLDPGSSLYQFIAQKSIADASAETFLVRREGSDILYLTELRHQQDAALVLRLPANDPDLPAALAFSQNNSSRELRDYRGVPVLAASRGIPGTAWKLITKIDVAEVYAPMMREALRTEALVILMVLVVILGTMVVWRQRHSAILSHTLGAEKQSKALASQLDSVLQQANDCIMLLDQRGYIVQANPRSTAQYGYTLDEFRQLPPGALRVGVAKQSLSEDLKSLQQPEGNIYETVHRTKPGLPINVEVSGRLIELNGQKFLLTIIRDITRRKQHETQIERLTRLYAALSSINQTIIRVKSREELFSEVCRVLVESGGVGLAWVGWLETETKAIVPIAHFGDDHGILAAQKVFADERLGSRCPTSEAIRNGRTEVSHDIASDPRMEARRDAAAQCGFASCLALPIRQDGKVAGALSVFAGKVDFFGDKEIALFEEAAEDIAYALNTLSNDAQRVKGEKERELMVARLEAIMEASPEGILVVDERKLCTVHNQQFAMLWQLSNAQLQKLKHSPALPVLFEYLNEPERLQATWARLEREPNSISFDTIELKDGRIFECYSQPQVVVGKTIGRVWSFGDITSRIAATATIEQEQSLNNALLDGLPDLIYFKDLESRFIRVNPAVAKRLGLKDPAEVVGRLEHEFSASSNVAQSLEDEKTILRTGCPIVNHEEKEIWPDRPPTWVMTTKMPLRDSAGKLIGTFGLTRDITEQKYLEEKFMRAQRLESIGMLAAGIAHDLNNILAPILMASTLLRDIHRGDREQHLLETIEKSAERGAGLVRQILGFSHGLGGERSTLQVKHLLRDIGDILTETLPKSIHFESDYPTDLWPITGNPTQIHQILLNLCVNARDAMPNGGLLLLSASNRTLTAEEASQIEGARAGSWLVIEVKDNGTGIPPEILHQIWQPFFTTKIAGKGTGLGLTTVRSIAASHNGFVTLESEVGVGTVFRVYLPADEISFEATPTQSPNAAPHGNGELILVVDDEENIRQIARDILSQHGYRVILAADGAEAADSFGSHASEIDLIITDLDMPNFDGLELIQVIRKINPNMKILIMSGGNPESKSKHTASGICGPLLNKPFDIQTLLQRVNEVFHPHAAS